MTFPLNPARLDLAQLPALPYAQRLSLPNAPGIYVVLSATTEVLYIGRAKSLCFRWQAHHRSKQFAVHTDLRIAWLAVSDPGLLDGIEQACLAHFQPLMNARPTYTNRVTIHFTTERSVRDRLLGALRAEGITMQDFFDDRIHLLATRPERLDAIQQWTAETPATPRKPRGRPAKVA